jgi:hypothetical protein
MTDSFSMGAIDSDTESSYPGEYKYCLTHGAYNHWYGKWSWREDDFSLRSGFFSVPEFMIAVEGDGKTIDIKIRDLQTVTTKYMREEIERIYTCFRQKIGSQRSKWGEKSGTRAIIKKRNRMLKEIYEKLRKEKPHASAYRQIEKSIDLLGEDFGKAANISPETAQRIIYSKNDMR